MFSVVKISETLLALKSGFGNIICGLFAAISDVSVVSDSKVCVSHISG